MADFRIVRTIGTTEPVTRDEVKNYLRIDNNQDDNLITQIITNARRQAEQFMNRDILAKERTIYLEYVDEPINLPYAPLNITRNSDGDLTNLTVTIDGVAATEDDDFEILGLDNPLIKFDGQDSFRRTGNRNSTVPARKVQITYQTAGYTDGIEQGILALCAWMYYGRDAKMPTNWKAWLNPFKIRGYYGTK